MKQNPWKGKKTVAEKLLLVENWEAYVGNNKIIPQ